MKQRLLVPGTILTGLCLLAVGLGWNHLVPSDAFWGDQQAQEYDTAQVELHAKSHSHGRDKQHEREVAAAKERFIKSYQALEYARVARNRTGTFIMAGGIGLLLLGIVVHMATGRPT
jgi:hypothetical protein